MYKSIKINYFPLFAFILYILFSFSLSVFGPINFDNYDYTSITIYLFNFLMIFCIGYISGVKTYKKKEVKVNNDKSLVFKLLKFFILITIFVKCIELFSMLLSGGSNFSISGLGEAYVNTYSDYERGSGNYSIMFILKIFTYLPYLVSIILGFFYFDKLNNYYKFMLLFILFALFLVETIGHGKQKQLGDIIIFSLTIFLLKSNLLFKKIKVKKIFYFTFIFILGLLFLIFVLKMRYDALGIDASNINEKVHPLMNYNLDHIIFDLFGMEWGFPIAVFTGYFTGGYYGLSLCLNIPFVWTYFVGNSYSMTLVLNKFLGMPLNIEDTYPYRVGELTGWDQTKWHSVFPWFASDLTFFGTLIMFLFISYVYAKVWIESIYYNNPLAVLFFAVLNLGLIYVPANNQLFHSPESYLSTILIFLLWILFHKRFNFIS